MESVGVRSGSGITRIRLDDGRANVLSVDTLFLIEAAFYEAEERRDVVVLTGRSGIFTAGFDLKVLATGLETSLEMIMAGFRLLHRVLSFPRPVVIGCTGHSLALGAFLLLVADYRIGVAGNFRIAANEVAMGMIMPRTALEVMRYRLTPSAFHRAAALSHVFGPESAIGAGFLDELVDEDEFDSRLLAIAESLGDLDERAHSETKRRARAEVVVSVEMAIEADRAEYLKLLARNRGD
jgi:enoyl-CoA hydratase